MPETTTATPAPATAPTPPPAKRIFTATGIIGPPGSGKTTLFDKFAEYLWETYARILLLYSWDGGAIPNQVQKRMKQGLIRFWRVRTRSGEGLGLETLYAASKGYWPRQIDLEKGETSPAVGLVGPVTASYEVRCPKAHPLRTVPTVALATQPTFCNDCKQMIQVVQLRIAETIKRTKGFEQVGGVGYDGLTSMCDVVMDHMDHARGAGTVGGEKAAFGGVVTSGGLRLGGNNRADVGFAQTRARQLVHNTLGIPYLVEGPVFTGLSDIASDDAGLPIVGMKLPGHAATDQATGWFGNMFEMGRAVDDGGKEHHALYLKPWTDGTGRRHLLKCSATSEGLPAVLIDPLPEEGGKPGSVANLGNVFRLLDEDLRQALTEEVKDAPGMPSGLVEYGEPIVSSGPATSGPGPASQIVGGAPMAAPGGAPAPAAPGAIPRPTPRASGRRAVAAPTPAPAAPAPQAQAAPPATAAPTPQATRPSAPPPGRPPPRAPGTE